MKATLTPVLLAVGMVTAALLLGILLAWGTLQLLMTPRLL